jgi:CheY-like chemotaxis protein
MGDQEFDILLVEDSPDDAAFFKHALETSGIPARLRVAAEGAEALEFMFCTGRYADRNPSQHPTVIFLDLKLPRGDGLEVLRRLKFDPGIWNVPVVVLTSSQEQRDLVHSYKLGVNSYVVKPMDFDQFAGTLRMLLQYWLRFNQTPGPGAGLSCAFP